MPAVRRGVKNHVVWPPFDTAFKYCFKRLVGRVLGVERKIVAKHDETVRGASCKRHQGWETVDVFPVDLDQFEWPRAFSVAQVGIDARVGSFDERGLSHAAGAPQQGIVGRKTLGKPLG